MPYPTTHPFFDAPPLCVEDIVAATNRLVRGRLLESLDHHNDWRVVKDSGISGKAVTELPGLVAGDPAAPARRVGVTMTLTEHTIELARAIQIDAVVVHHPVADAASSGGVELVHYLSLYGISVIECHEALHGLHPGIAWLHGHTADTTDARYDGVDGMVVTIGRPHDDIVVAGDVLRRVEHLTGRPTEVAVGEAEASVRRVSSVADSCTAPRPRMIVGTEDDKLGDLVAHVYPHTGFGAAQLRSLRESLPSISSVIVSISTVDDDDDLARECAAAGLPLISGSLHSYEIIENGVPLAFALQHILPEVEVLLLRERVTALPLDGLGDDVSAYGHQMAQHLIERALP